MAVRHRLKHFVTRGATPSNQHANYRDAQISELIKGKRVCFVGASPILNGKATGELIDSFDVVVKTGGAAWIDSSEYKKCYGSRIDILYTNSQFSKLVSPFNDRLNKIKHFRLKFPERRWLSTGKASAMYKSWNQIASLVVNPTLGTIATHDILSLEPSELYLTGMDFYTSREYTQEERKHTEYVDGYIVKEFVDNYLATGRPMPDYKGKKWDLHNHYSNSMYFKGLLDQDKISMPDYVKEALFESIKRFAGVDSPACKKK